MKPADILDVEAVADLLGVKPQTVHQWVYRGLLPQPAGHVSDRPWWRRADVLRWAEATGRGTHAS